MARRKHAEPDAFERLLRGAFERLAERWRLVAAAAVGLLIAVVCAALLSGSAHRHEEDAHAQLAKALDAEKDRAEALLAVAEAFGGTSAAREALLRAARELRDEASSSEIEEAKRREKLALAEKALRRFLGTAGGEELELLATEELAFALEDQGRLAESAELLRRTLVAHPDAFLQAKLSYELGRVEFALGPEHYEDARSHLQRALDDSGVQRPSEARASWQQAALFLLAGLEKAGQPGVEVELPIPSGDGEEGREETPAPEGEPEEAGAEPGGAEGSASGG